jgi:pimeloyl-ACP methyl ester carboxylesterase
LKHFPAAASTCRPVSFPGHWVQQEQPEQVSRLLLEFLKQASTKI